jgi:hypothetical protein
LFHTIDIIFVATANKPEAKEWSRGSEWSFFDGWGITDAVRINFVWRGHGQCDCDLADGANSSIILHESIFAVVFAIFSK